MSKIAESMAYGGQLNFLREDEENDEGEASSIDVTFGNTASHNVAGVILQDDVETLDVRGGNGRQFVDLHADVGGGTVSLGGGGDEVIARQGTRIDGVDFRLGVGDDSFRQERGIGLRRCRRLRRGRRRQDLPRR